MIAESIMLKNGKYKTLAGSTMTITGRHGGISTVNFDWLEEPGACCDCEPDPYDDNGFLTWHCEYCGNGRSKLKEIG